MAKSTKSDQVAGISGQAAKLVLTGRLFLPTAHSTADDKAAFGNHLLEFIRQGCPQTMWEEWFYKRLSMCFGFIAHFNAAGFWSCWLSTPQQRLRFVNTLMTQNRSGSPSYTYCDVERCVSEAIKAECLIRPYMREALENEFERDMDELERLAKAYLLPSVVTLVERRRAEGC